MSDSISIYRRLLAHHGGDAARAKQALRAIYKILLADAQAWWYHRELRRWGVVDEAHRLEMASVRSGMETLRNAVYAHIAALGGRWVIHRRVEYHPNGGYTTGAHEGHGGIETPIIQCCLLLGIPVLDLSTEGCDIRRILNIPDEKRPHEVSPWYGGTLEGFIAECLAAGARLVNS